MNETLQDLITAINRIPGFYYSMPAIAVHNDNLATSTRSEEVKYYERRFVAHLKSEYDNLIKNGATENYQDVNTDLEVIKKYIYSERPDNAIVDAYKKLTGRDNKKTFDTITTIPGFFIHKEQDDWDEEFQRLAMEVKTLPAINTDDFFLDLFKINVYVEKYHFQNGVYLLVNNDFLRIEELTNDYKREGLYLAPTGQERIHLFVKTDYNSDVKIFNLIDK